MSSSNTIEIE